MTDTHREVAASDGLWKPIQTAPKDGTRILVYWPNCPMNIVHWSEFQQSWLFDFDDRKCNEPTHWRPRPTAPHVREDAQRRRE